MGDYAIRMQLDVDADPATVREALDTEQGIASWWTTGTRLDDARHRLQTSFPDVPQPFEFAVDARPTVIRWVTGGFPPWWAGTTVSWALEPNPERPGTRVQFVHGGYEPDNPVIPIVTLAWAQILLRLKGYVETGNPQPFFSA